MQSIKSACQPRKTIFDRNRRDVVLDISDITEGHISPDSFFSENYLTEGMKILFKEVFRRFANESDTSVFKLTQAMGGGKTHCMIGLALLAKHPEYRDIVMGTGSVPAVPGKIKVITFNGRESDAPYGIWGSIADQLGKKDFFKDYYSPLQAPGKTAWVNLLKGERLLILFDELPPYFENAKAKTIGNTDLSVVTKTALSNLLIALGHEDLSQVCVVLSDLKATYEGGSQNISQSLRDFEHEVGRSAVNIEPVGLNTDEVFQILKKRIFTTLPDTSTISSIAEGYAAALKEAGQMDLIHISPEKFALQVKQSYPFHPAIKDLYARFRENPGFQQTRGLIRFMRVMISHLYESDRADSIYLIHPHMIDLNHPEMVSEINLINQTLGNAISHDIASEGNAVAEIEDVKRGGTDASDICNLILVSSLANIENPVLGLTGPEIMTYLATPGRNIATIPDMIGTLESQLCWYLHKGNDGRIYFKNTENLVARLRSLSESYSREIALKELKEYLLTIFTPEKGDCYQEVTIFPAIDDITISSDKVKLVLYEPHPGGLHPDLRSYYEDLDYKNRVCFLSGQRDTMDTLISVGKEYKAIKFILSDFDSQNLRSDDTQRIIAHDLKDHIIHRLLSAARETFTRLYYPQDEIMATDIIMNFEGNRCRGELLIRNTLADKQKFTEDIDSDTFKKKCELRLFTQPVMKWSEIKKRAAILTKWQWHHPNALDTLKSDMIRKDQWREEGDYINKGPFEQPKTNVQVIDWDRDDDTGEVTLKITPVRGDIVYYEIGGTPTSASARVEDYQNFKISSMHVSFLCVDSTGTHEPGEVYHWSNKVTLKKRVFGDEQAKTVEIKSAPPDAPIRYTTDGSNPRQSGGIYQGQFKIDRSVSMVLAIAEFAGVESEQIRIDITWGDDEVEINPRTPATWKNQQKFTETQDTYVFTSLIDKHHAKVTGVRISVVGKKWVELNIDDTIALTGQEIESSINSLREINNEGQVGIDTKTLVFNTGQDLKDYANTTKKTINMDEVIQ